MGILLERPMEVPMQVEGPMEVPMEGSINSQEGRTCCSQGRLGFDPNPHWRALLTASAHFTFHPW